MGQCLTCFRANPIPRKQQDFNNVSGLNLIPNYHNTSFYSTSCTQEYESNKDLSESRNSLTRIEGRSPVPPFDSQSNGSSKNSNIVAMPEKRSFYSRIQPLTKSSSNEMRKFSSRECSEIKINALFDHYKDSHSDLISADGIIRLCTDLDVKPDDFRVLVLAWKFNAETMCQFTREEFLMGCKVLRSDSIKAIQSKFPELIAEVQNAEKFKDLYRFTYKFGLDTDSGQRILPSDIAILLWKLVFSQNEPPILQRWIDFIEKHPSIRGIPRDTWFMFLNFTETVADDLSLYDDTEAWPSLLDDFVEYENDQLNQNIKKDKEIN